MTQNIPIPCPECDSVKYFEGLCYPCKNKKIRAHYESMTRDQCKNCCVIHFSCEATSLENFLITKGKEFFQLDFLSQ